MKFCPNCGTELAEGATECSSCGTPVTTAPVPVVNEFDHTEEFDAEDIEKNKIFAVLGYLIGVPGLIITYLAAKDSPFAMFHAKQALKIEITSLLIVLATSLLFWTCIVPVAACILVMIIFVLEIIAIFQVFLGRAKDLWLIRSLKFLGK